MYDDLDDTMKIFNKQKQYDGCNNYKFLHCQMINS